MLSRLLPLALVIFAGPTLIGAPEAAAPSAGAMAEALSAKQSDGASYIRLKMEVKQGGAVKNALQLQIKSRASRAGTELVYQVLWPKERKGEAVMLKRSGGRMASGAVFTPPDSVRPLDASKMDDPLFGSDLSYEDVIDNFFAWEQQSIVGTETIDRVNCQILESKPGKSARSSYTSVKTWVDPRRMVPMRVEKFSGNRLVRRIDTTRVVTDDKGRQIPANLAVHSGSGDSVTELDGSRIKHNVSFTEDEFTPEGLKAAGPARGGAE